MKLERFRLIIQDGYLSAFGLYRGKTLNDTTTLHCITITCKYPSSCFSENNLHRNIKYLSTQLLRTSSVAKHLTSYLASIFVFYHLTLKYKQLLNLYKRGLFGVRQIWQLWWIKVEISKKLNYKIPIQGRPFASQKPNLQNSDSKRTLIMISRRSLTCSPKKVEFGGIGVGRTVSRIYYFSDKG